jgi:hypothetical protein
VTAEAFSARHARRPVSRKTLNALYRDAAAVVSEHKLAQTGVAARDIAAGELSLDELAQVTRKLVESETHVGKTRDLALLLLEVLIDDGGQHRIGPGERAELAERLGISVRKLPDMLKRLSGSGMFIVKGGSGGHRITTVGFNADLVAAEAEPELWDADLERMARGRGDLEQLRRSFKPEMVEPIVAAIHEGFGDSPAAAAAFEMLEMIVAARGYYPVTRGIFDRLGASSGNDARCLFKAKNVGGVAYLTIGQPRTTAEPAARRAIEGAQFRPEQRADREAAAEAVAAMKEALDAGRAEALPLILAEHDLIPADVADVLREPYFDRRTAHYVRRQEKGHAEQLGYLVRRLEDVDGLRLTLWEKRDNDLMREDGGVTLATVAEFVLSKAFIDHIGYVEWWAEKCAAANVPRDLPPSKLIGILPEQACHRYEGSQRGHEALLDCHVLAAPPARRGLRAPATEGCIRTMSFRRRAPAGAGRAKVG